MPELSHAVAFAWQVAADEALQLHHTCIDPQHMFIGVCSVGKLLTPEVQRRTTLTSQALASVHEEWEALQALLSEVNANPAGLRRAMRTFLGTGDSQVEPGARVKRSPATQAVFARAAKLAETISAPQITLLHLVGALLEPDSGPVATLLATEGLDVEKLKASALDRATSLSQRAATHRSLPLDPAQHAGAAPAMPTSSVAVPAAPRPQVAESMDASMAPYTAAPTTTGSARSLAVLYELPLQFGAVTELGVLLQLIVERLVEAIPGADRGALLVKESTSDELRLRAHVPPGDPGVSLTLARRAMEQRQGLIWRRGKEDLSSSLVEQCTESGMYAPLLWQGQTLGVVCVNSRQEGCAFDHQNLRLLVAIAHHAAMAVANHQMQEALRLKSMLLERMLTNFSPRIRDNLLDKAARGRLRLGGEKSEVTILFSDIRGFTRLSAAHDAEVVVDMLNHYLGALVDAIFRHDGTIDKFVGDAILTVFGSPEPDPRQQEKAVRSALEMQAAMADISRTRAERGQLICEIGIGIHCGEVLHGFIGTQERMEFTVIGDAVNRAARYCAAAPGGEVLLSPQVHERVWRSVEVEASTISTKHEGDLPAYRLKRLKASAPVS